MATSNLSLFSKQTIALAGVAQAAAIADQLATRGSAPDAEQRALLESILVTEPDTIRDIYADPADLTMGLELLERGVATQSRYVQEYFASMVHLPSPLLDRDDYCQIISRGIEDIKGRLNFFEITDNTILAAIADLYTQTISHLLPRVMIRGEKDILRQTDVQNRIRAILLAGIRSGVLWTQYGGSRFKLGFSQRKISDEARRILQNL